ncbi:hypothetical protein STCU_11706 [Strigomonas culicis]|uniref:Surface antigen-like protein n=1 Tax=Strigomonas culicis TaxID=28005 RepID=S9TCW3_9TRYP|nr:hypothetical protein STCU_11706 [Strigomonas culicis]|eukprot:EPY15867.1 hypothetical protein STCU_11706 [Strigomonas culicis]
MPCNTANCNTCVTEQDTVCDTCEANYKLDTDGATCTEKVCQVEICTMCVFNREDQCDTCATGYTVSNSDCAAVPSSNGLSKNALIGIIAGVVLALLAVVLLLLFVLCGRRKKTEKHAVEIVPPEVSDKAHKATKENAPMCETDEQIANASCVPQWFQRSQSRSSRRRSTRSPRGTSRSAFTFEDVDLEAMCDEGSAIHEETAQSSS